MSSPTPRRAPVRLSTHGEAYEQGGSFFRGAVIGIAIELGACGFFAALTYLVWLITHP